jgi:hypothetical protein
VWLVVTFFCFLTVSQICYFRGFFAKTSNQTVSHYVHSISQLNEIFENPAHSEVVIHMLGDYERMGLIEHKYELSPIDSKTSALIASWTTALARLVLYKYMQRLKPHQYIYHDTDSLVRRVHTRNNDQNTFKHLVTPQVWQRDPQNPQSVIPNGVLLGAFVFARCELG